MAPQEKLGSSPTEPPSHPSILFLIQLLFFHPLAKTWGALSILEDSLKFLYFSNPTTQLCSGERFLKTSPKSSSLPSEPT